MTMTVPFHSTIETLDRLKAQGRRVYSMRHERDGYTLTVDEPRDCRPDLPIPEHDRKSPFERPPAQTNGSPVRNHDPQKPISSPFSEHATVKTPNENAPFTA